MDETPRSHLDPVAVVRRAGGVARRPELLELVTRQRLDAAIKAGTLIVVRRSTIALADHDAGLVAARAARGVLAGESAALHWSWPVKRPPREPVVIVPRNRSHSLQGVNLLRRPLPSEAAVDHVLTPTATVIDCARSVPFDAALAVADSALRSRRVSRADLTAALTDVPTRFRPRVERVITAADRRAANPFESVARAIALDVPGLTVEPQGDVDGIGHGDLVDHRLRLVIECDSWEHHSQKEPFRRDVRRYNRMVLADWTVIRLLWEDVMAYPERVRSHLIRAVALCQSLREPTR
jgi:very-short-patch-repair endonuclease